MGNCTGSIFEHRCPEKDLVVCKDHCGKAMCSGCYSSHLADCIRQTRSNTSMCPTCYKRMDACWYCNIAQHCPNCSPNQSEICYLNRNPTFCEECGTQIIDKRHYRSTPWTTWSTPTIILCSICVGTWQSP